MSCSVTKWNEINYLSNLKLYDFKMVKYDEESIQILLFNVMK